MHCSRHIHNITSFQITQCDINCNTIVMRTCFLCQEPAFTQSTKPLLFKRRRFSIQICSISTLKFSCHSIRTICIIYNNTFSIFQENFLCFCQFLGSCNCKPCFSSIFRTRSVIELFAPKSMNSFASHLENSLVSHYQIHFNARNIILYIDKNLIRVNPIVFSVYLNCKLTIIFTQDCENIVLCYHNGINTIACRCCMSCPNFASNKFRSFCICRKRHNHDHNHSHNCHCQFLHCRPPWHRIK